jgi:hypothetical protein
VAQADQAVADAQSQADHVAGAYFSELERARQLDSQIAALRDSTDALQQRLSSLKEIANERAVQAYERAGSALEIALPDPSTPMDSARRIVLLRLLNARDDDAASALRSSRDDLRRHQQDLKSVRQREAVVVARLEDAEQQANAKLVAAQNQRQLAVQQHLEAVLQAQQQASAAAQAAAPTTQAPSTSEPPAPAAPAAKAGTPAPVPSNYTPTTGLNPHHDDPYLRCVRHYESSDNYQAYNPGGPALGAYQFLQTTWNLAANHAGRADLVGLDPRRASEYDQDEMAWDVYQWQGKRPWTADPC